MYKLIIEDDEGKTTVVPLIRDEITIGRKEGNTIRLTERNVSRRHAKLSRANGTVFIEDLQSFNGIRVNGDRIAGKAPVTEGDRIQIGDYQLALKLDKAAAAPEPEPAPPPPEARTAQIMNPDVTRAIAPDGVGVGAGGVTRIGPVAGGPPPAAPPPPAPAPVAAAERPARLVVVSSNFAGKEFPLDKAQCVIGRTEENDVVIDHRSISRHHAKIVREQGRYQVVDLGSANGVRVNGEDYGKVELRKGDLIDLGHVRLRFVAPGEDFVFSRDAQVVEETGVAEKKKSPIVLILGAVAALLLLGGIGMFAFKGKEPEAPAPGGVATSGASSDVLQAVDKALASESWDEAIAAASRGLAADPGNAALKEKKARAESERKNQGTYSAFLKAAGDGDADRAVTLFQELPDGSAYHKKAQDSWPDVKAAYIKDHIGKARDLAGAGRCPEAKQQIEKVLEVDDANAQATQLAARCGQPAVAPSPRPAVARPVATPAPRPERPTVATPRPEPAAPAPRPEQAARPVATPKPEAPPPEKPAGASAGDLLADAQNSYVHGGYQDAIDKARKALKESPGDAKAWRLIGASSCFLKDKPGASTAWNKLGNVERQFLKYVCDRNGITLP